MRYQAFQTRAFYKRTLVAVALTAAFSSAWALPLFTLNPAGAGLPGTEFTADNIVISDFSKVTFSDPTHFTDQGFLSVVGFQNGGAPVDAPGLNTAYSLYFRFLGTGHLTSGSVATLGSAPSTGLFDTLDYELVGQTGVATFDVSGAVPSVTGGPGTLLANGSLMFGSVGSTQETATKWVPNAAATVSFNTVAAGFFTSPVPFYNVALSAFINTSSQVTLTADGFTIKQGGGAVNFTSQVPEPETYALMLAGLGAVGFMARRRRS